MKNSTLYDQIDWALDTLISRKKLSFLMIRHQPTGKFMQFSSSMQDPLVLDVLASSLSELEFYRATEFFRRFGVEAGDINPASLPEGSPPVEHFSFMMECDALHIGSEIATAFFREVCQITGDEGFVFEGIRIPKRRR